MSEGKCDSYYVDAQIALQRRIQALREAAHEVENQLAAARNRARRLEAQSSIAIAVNFDVAAGKSGEANTVEDLEQYISRVHLLIAEIDLKVERAEGLTQLRSLVATTAQVDQVADWSDKFQQRVSTPRKGPDETVVDQRESIARRILDRLDGSATDEESRGIRNALNALRAAQTSVQVEGLESELRFRVQRANDRLQKGKQDSIAAAGLISELAGLKGDDVDSIVKELKEVINGRAPMEPSCSQRVAAIRKSAERRMNDKYVGEVVREELRRLGYELGSNFSNLFIEGGNVVVQRPEQGEYGVQITVDSARGLMNADIVRLREVDRYSHAERQLRDKEAGEKWCADHEKLLAAAQSHGIRSRVIKKTPAGTHAVPLVPEGMRRKQPRQAPGVTGKQRDQ